MKKSGFPVLSLTGCTLLLILGGVVFAQVSPVPVDQAPQVNPPAALLAPAQLDSLVSPIALYPDPLLSQVLVASTYPLEIVEAAQWLRQNPSLTGAAAQSAASGQNWDPSIQALVLFPDVLFRMADDVQWTTDLGNAFLAQQSAVMDAVQHLRSEAMASGNLSSNPQTTVTTETQGDSNAVEILPANSEVIYVPEYDPTLIWGPELYPYPFLPYFHSPFGYGYGFMGYGPGIFVGSFFAGWGGWGGWGRWGWRPNWFGRTVMVNNNFFSRYGYNRFGVGGGIRQSGSPVWAHNPIHRGNVPYANPAVAAQFHSGFRGAAAGRPPISALRSASAPALSFTRPASPVFGSARPAPGNAYRSGPSRGFASPRGYFTPNRTAPAPNFRNAPAPNFRSSRSYGSAPAMRGGGQWYGQSGRQSFGRSGGGPSFGRSGGWGGRSGGGRSGGGRGGRR